MSRLVKELEDGQRRALFMMELRKSVAEAYRSELGEGELEALAEALLDGTGFEILRELREVQRLTESELSASRTALRGEQERQRAEQAREGRPVMSSTTFYQGGGGSGQGSSLPDLRGYDERCEEELKRQDMRTLLELDQLVAKQQQTLEKAGLPTFAITNNPLQLRLQMYVIQLVDKLHTVYEAPVDSLY